MALLALAPALATAQDIRREHLFDWKTDGIYYCYRIPALVRATDDSLLAIAEGRVDGPSDHGDIDLVMRRSEDGGETWSRMRVIHDFGDHTAGNPAPVVDRDTGRIHLLFCRDNRRVFVIHSDDHGVTWSDAREITRDVSLPGWRWYATGPVHGIQLERGAHAGRLVVPCDYNDGVKGSHVVYSDDHGATWKLGGRVHGRGDLAPNECTVVELVDGRLALNMRNQNQAVKGRIVAYSEDGGTSFGQPVLDPQLVDPVVQASLLRLEARDRGDDRDWILFSNPASAIDRVGMTIWSSFDETASWATARRIYDGESSYSNLGLTADGTVCCLYEGGEDGGCRYIEFARLDRSWLATPLPDASAMIRDDFDGDAGFAGAWRTTPGARLLGWWRFDGDGDDLGPGGHTARLEGPDFDRDVPPALGRGRSLRFERGDHVDLRAALPTLAQTRTGTVSAFVRTAGKGVLTLLAASDSGDASREWRLFLAGGRLRYDVRGDDGDSAGMSLSPDPINDDRWHHTAVTVDHLGQARIYIDGHEVVTAREPWFAAVHDLDVLSIGRNVDADGPQWPFEGHIDDVSIFAQALEPAAIAAIAHGGDPRTWTTDVEDPGFARAHGNLLGGAGAHRIATGGIVATRRLEVPIGTHGDGSLSVSCLVQTTSDEPTFSIALEGAGEPLLRFGLDGEGRAVASVGSAEAKGDRVFGLDRAVRLVCELRCAAGAPRSLSLIAARTDAPVDSDARPLLVLDELPVAAGRADHVTIRTGPRARIAFDALRVGGKPAD